MPTYKIYDLTSYGQVKLPSRLVSCRNDSDAIFAAYQFHRGADQEIWQDKRRVSVVNANELIRMSAMASDMHETVVLTRKLINHSRECLRNADRVLAPRRVHHGSA